MQLKIEKEKGLVKFSNATDHKLCIYLKPVKPEEAFLVNSSKSSIIHCF